MSTVPPVVEFRKVTKTFDEGSSKAFTALKEIEFSIVDKPGEGEFISLIGPSGCGKSTILNLIQGFPEVYPPTSGEVIVRGRRVTGPGRDRGMIFQRYSSFPHLTVMSNVLFGLEINNQELQLQPEEMLEQAKAIIERVGLGGHDHKYPHQLSGGQQQRVAIARSLILKPRIILMDEPFSALDEPTRLEMQRLITELWHEVEATVFLVTHSISEAVYLGDRVWLMNANPGRISKIFEHPAPRHGDDPLRVQETPEFKEAVTEVANLFTDLEER